MKVRRGLIWILLGIILAFSIRFLIYWPDDIDKKARITETRVWAQNIASFLKQYAVENGSLTNFNNHSIVQSEFGTNNFRPPWTNSQGEIVDYWKTPFQIENVAQTNFIIRSAGPNKIFGDADDVIFNSASNGFVKP
jgi:type II secretory pathway pseudopilin PulG